VPWGKYVPQEKESLETDSLGEGESEQSSASPKMKTSGGCPYGKRSTRPCREQLLAIERKYEGVAR